MENKLPKLRVGYLPILDHLTLAVAQHQQNNQFENFSLELKEFLNWNDLSKALNNNQLDATFILAPLAIELFRQGLDIQIILLGHREGQVLVVTNEINSLADLKGKKIHLPHRFSTHHILLAKEFADNNINLSKDCKIIFGYKNIRLAGDDLSGAVTDAFMVAEPMGTEVRRRNIGKILEISREMLSHHADCVLVVRKNIIENKPDVVQELVDNLVSAGAFINAYPRQAAEITAKIFSWPVKTILEALTHHRGHILFWDLLPRLEDFEYLQDMAMANTDLWNEPIDLGGLLETKFAQKAYRDWVINWRQEVKDRGQTNTLPINFLEANNRLSAILKKPCKIMGIYYIESGEQYPVGIERKEHGVINFSLIFQEIFDKEIILTNIAGFKAVALMQPNNDRIPDSVLIAINAEELERFQKALGFGTCQYQCKSVKRVEELFDKSTFAKIYQNKETFYLIMPWQVFRFLVLILENL